jgi:predicted enzyme related to lactoylglutathione lyase
MESNLISWIEIPVTNMERAKAFYETVFNIEIKIETFQGVFMGWFPIYDKKPGASGALVLNEAYTPSDTKGVLIYFSSNDISKQLETVVENGGAIIQNFTEISPEIGAMGLFTDTEGNRIALYSNPKL